MSSVLAACGGGEATEVQTDALKGGALSEPVREPVGDGCGLVGPVLYATCLTLCDPGAVDPGTPGYCCAGSQRTTCFEAGIYQPGDRDNDGIPDPYDNCVFTPNPGQANSDQDALGDACDNCPQHTNPEQYNIDNDAFGDVCDDDMDGDGLLNNADNCPTVHNPAQADLDADQIGDACDDDDDGDGALDVGIGADNCPRVFNPDQRNQDGDYWGDVCDNCPRTYAPHQHDADGDGVGDVCEEEPWIAAPGAGLSGNLLATTPSCTSEDWLAKYITYRRRFLGDGTAAQPGFVDVGPGPGQSMVAAERSPKERAYRWADTTVYHGRYLAMLASEARVFSMLGTDTQQTHQELFYALEAFNRLDSVSETFFGQPSEINGWFLRSDVPQDFMIDNGQERFPGYDVVRSNATVGADLENGDVMSVDQIVHMFWGLAAVIELVDPNAVVNGLNLRYAAQAIMHRIMEGRIDAWKARGDWLIRDPNGVAPALNNHWGANLTFAHSLAEIADIYVGTLFRSKPYTDGIVAGHLNDQWNLWPIATSPVNRAMALTQIMVMDRFPADTMARRAAKIRDELSPLVREVLRGDPMSGDAEDWMVEALLTRAPCSGPCQGTTGCDEVDGWKSPFRFGPQSKSRSMHFYAGETAGNEYTGLDYMLLHNFYLIHKAGAYDAVPRSRSNAGCAASSPLDQLLSWQFPASGSPRLTRRYAAWDRCTEPDMRRRFCGRSFASWLKAASEGKATIFTPGYRWTCVGQGDCTLSFSTAYGAQGTDGPDLILGTAAGEFIDGQKGSDCIYGFGGADTVQGGRGFDELHGGAGNDHLYGEWQGLVAEGESDMLFGEDGDDVLRPSKGNDDSDGGPGDDNIVEDGPGHDVLIGGPGDDFMQGKDGTDTLVGGAGDDRLEGGGGDDCLSGGAGDDSIDAGPGFFADRAFAGPGNDDIWTGPGNDFIAVADVAGSGLVEFNKLDGAGGDDYIWCGHQPCEIWGGDGDDYLAGSPGRDTIDGGSGNDVLRGQEGDDFLRGGAGADLLLGGEGDDRLCGNDGLDYLDALDPNNAVHADLSWMSFAGNDSCNGGVGMTYSDPACQALADSDCTRTALLGW